MHYTFTHVGKLTGLYRYKFAVMKQIRLCRDIKHLIYCRFNTGEVKKGPGTGFWGPAYRIWVMFLRGMVPLLQRYLNNLLSRLFEGRGDRGIVKRVTKQRQEANMDINLKAALRQSVLELGDTKGLKLGSTARVVEQHASEAFRCWKANIPWKVRGMPAPIQHLIERYVKTKAEHYIQHTYRVREAIDNGQMVNKGAFMKNLGRLTRLKLRDEHDRQNHYLATGPYISPNEAVKIHALLARWVEVRNIKKIDFPKMGHEAEIRLLHIALNRLRMQHNLANRLTQSEREEQKRIEDAFDNPQEALNRIRESLARDRTFSNVQVEYIDNYSTLAPIYVVDPQRKMVDAFLDQYLWYEASRGGLFPNWVKPSDLEPAPLLVHQWCQAINGTPQVWSTSSGEVNVLLQAQLDNFFENVDWTLMRSLLCLVVHPMLAEYLCARHDVVLEYKDMMFKHHVGLIRGYQFASFLAQLWGLAIDLMLIGSERALQFAGPPGKPNPSFKFAEPHFYTNHPHRLYLRYVDRCYFFLRYSKQEAQELVDRYLDANPDPEAASVLGFRNKSCWPRDARVRLFRNDVLVCRAVLWDYQRRLPPAVARIDPATSFTSIYSKDNPNVLFDMCGFELRMLPVSRTSGDPIDCEHMWSFKDPHSRELTCRAYLQVAQEHVIKIQNRIRRTIASIGNSAFEKIAQKWNSLVSELVPYYREAILGTEGLQETFVRGEVKIQARIKMALNSKMPDRFPPVVFYSPNDIGGLGMLSIGAALIPAADRAVRNLTSDIATQFFVQGMTHDAEDILLPNILRCYPSWEREFTESQRVWEEYRYLYNDAKKRNKRLGFDDLEHIIDLGIPRIRTLFQKKDRETLAHDKGWRVRQEFQQFIFGRYLRNWWFSDGHDGRLCGGLDEYRKTMIQALGGVEAILDHTLFKGTGLTSWEGLFWNKAGSFEDQKKNAKITKAQRGGLTKVPNRRFALWWSPTINRRNVYVGYESQVDLTGIRMCGKLEMIKVALVSLFSGHLWEKIHSSVVVDIGTLLSTPDRQSLLSIAHASIEPVHAKKSFTLNTSCPDVVLQCASGRWPVSRPSLLSDEGDEFGADGRATAKYWIDVQLRWGNYDEHNIASYARSKYNEYSRSGVTRYPNATGIVIAIDLSYNCCSAFGYWIPELKGIIRLALAKIMKYNPALHALREKMKKMLMLYTSDPTEAHLTAQNLSELLGDQTVWLVDESHVFVTSCQSTAEGNRRFRAENGALLIVNVKTGQLMCSIVHKSVFQGQKRRTKLAREKAAEEVVTWLRSLPAEERPHKIICIRQHFVPILTHTLLDFKDIVISRCDRSLNLPLPMIMRHQKLGSLVATATEAKSLRFQLYDDWATILPAGSCFQRLLLLLRSFHVSVDATLQTLFPDRHVKQEPAHFWPTLSLEEWESVEGRIQELIIADYCRRHGITASSLTRNEKRDIILGQEITAPELQKEEIAELEKKTKTQLVAPQLTQTVNAHGELITTQSTKTFETGSLATGQDWRPRALAAVQLKTDRITARNTATTSELTLVLPVKVVKSFMKCSDHRVPIIGVLMGTAVPQQPGVLEVRAILLPPQCGSHEAVDCALSMPSSGDPDVAKLQPVGWLRTAPSVADAVPTTNDLLRHAKVLSRNPTWNPLWGAVVLATSDLGGHCTLSAFTATPEGVKWGMNHSPTAQLQAVDAPTAHFAPLGLRIAETIGGFFLLPAHGGWNYAFRRQYQWATAQYAIKIDAPSEFFSSEHRPLHFAALQSPSVDTGDGSVTDGTDGVDGATEAF